MSGSVRIVEIGDGSRAYFQDGALFAYVKPCGCTDYYLGGELCHSDFCKDRDTMLMGKSLKVQSFEDTQQQITDVLAGAK